MNKISLFLKTSCVAWSSNSNILCVLVGNPTLQFTKSAFSGNEGEEAVLDLILNKALDCCTVSVKVQIQDGNAKGM